MFKKEMQSFIFHSLIDRQVHIGSNYIRWDKSLNFYLFGIRHKVLFFNLKRTHLFIKRLTFFLYSSVIHHKAFLFIGTGTFLHPLINYIKNALNQPSINIHWVGGTLTTWFTIRKYTRFLYSKKVLSKVFHQFELKSSKSVHRRIARYLKMKEKLYGLEFASQIPNIIICLEKEWNEYALHETFLLRLPLICFINTHSHFSNIMFPVLGNTSSQEAFHFYLNLILNSIKKGFLKRRLAFIQFKSLTISKKKSFKDRSKRKQLANLNLNLNEYTKFFLKSNLRGILYSQKILNRVQKPVRRFSSKTTKLNLSFKLVIKKLFQKYKFFTQKKLWSIFTWIISTLKRKTYLNFAKVWHWIKIQFCISLELLPSLYGGVAGGIDKPINEIIGLSFSVQKETMAIFAGVLILAWSVYRQKRVCPCCSKPVWVLYRYHLTNWRTWEINGELRVEYDLPGYRYRTFLWGHYFFANVCETLDGIPSTTHTKWMCRQCLRDFAGFTIVADKYGNFGRPTGQDKLWFYKCLLRHREWRLAASIQEID